jgi:hypothetical protein
MITLCKACGTSYGDSQRPVERCKICEDERQFVPVSGQAWIGFDELIRSHTNKWLQHTPQLFSLKTVPSFAINQRAFLIRTPAGNVLWDCIANLDPATRTLIHALGGLRAIAISHPHYYTTMQDWAEAFDVPIWLHAADRAWIMRDSPRIRLWEGEQHALLPGVTLLRLGGHFPGGTVLYQEEGEGTIFTGDILQVTPGADAVSFMWSYPNMLPLSSDTVAGITHRLEAVKFASLYGAFEGLNITADAHAIVQRSGAKYLSCLTSR